MDHFVTGMRYGLLAGGAVVGFAAVCAAMLLVASLVAWICGRFGDKEDEDAGEEEEAEEQEEEEQEERSE